MGDFKHDSGDSVIALLFTGLALAAGDGSAIVAEVPETRSAVRPELSLGFPQPVSVGLSVRLSEESELLLQGGAFRLPVGGGGNQVVGIASVELGARYQPGRFQWTAFSGFRSAFITLGLSTVATTYLQTWYAGAAVAYTFRIGRALEGSFGLGIELPVVGGATMVFEGPAGSDSASSPVLSRVARYPIPRVTLFRLSLL